MYAMKSAGKEGNDESRKHKVVSLCECRKKCRVEDDEEIMINKKLYICKGKQSGMFVLEGGGSSGKMSQVMCFCELYKCSKEGNENSAVK